MTDDTRLTRAEDSRIDLGQTHLRAQDLVMPRVKVVQQLSQEATDEKAKAGDFYNTLTGEVLETPLLIQPILPFMQRVFLLRGEKRAVIDQELAERGLPELPEGDGLKCRSFDMEQGRGDPGVLCESQCPLSQWRGNEPPRCTELYNVAASTMIGELVIMSFSKSSAKIGKRFFSAIRLSGVKPWALFYELTTTRMSNDKGTYYVPDFRRSKEKPDTGQLEQALRWAAELKGVQIDVTPDDEPGDGNGAPDVHDPDAPF